MISQLTQARERRVNNRFFFIFKLKVFHKNSTFSVILSNSKNCNAKKIFWLRCISFTSQRNYAFRIAVYAFGTVPGTRYSSVRKYDRVRFPYDFCLWNSNIVFQNIYEWSIIFILTINMLILFILWILS